MEEGDRKIPKDAQRGTQNLQKNRRMFERLFESAPDAIVLVDGDGALRQVNQQAEALFGYRVEELIGRPVELLIPERFQECHRQHRRDYFAAPRIRRMGAGLELFGRHRSGREIPVDIMLSPIETDEGTWALAVIRDITERKQAETALKEHEERIRLLNEELGRQVDRLAATNRELEAFAYSVSHDLRAPLRHITGFVELLNKKELDALDEKSRHYLRVISESAQKMGALIDDLLAFSRMGRAEMMKARVDTGRMVKWIIADLEAETKGREIDWEIAPLPEVYADSAMLRLVMVNLISNALKFTRPRPRARIEIGTSAGHPGETLFYVRDNGVGFDMKYVDKLFGLFQRLHGPEEFEGTGVGLANVQRIIHRHGGRVWAEGAPDRGATFWFSLPETETSGWKME